MCSSLYLNRAKDGNSPGRRGCVPLVGREHAGFVSLPRTSARYHISPKGVLYGLFSFFDSPCVLLCRCLLTSKAFPNNMIGNAIYTIPILPMDIPNGSNRFQFQLVIVEGI
jgi:hypothetical protein